MFAKPFCWLVSQVKEPRHDIFHNVVRKIYHNLHNLSQSWLPLAIFHAVSFYVVAMNVLVRAMQNRYIIEVCKWHIAHNRVDNEVRGPMELLAISGKTLKALQTATMTLNLRQTGRRDVRFSTAFPP